jgi:hypothetical protein
MSNYTKSTNFASKDNLSSGNPLKIVKGTEIDTEFNNIATAVATKLDSVATTGSGNIVLATSPTLVTPALGTPSALVGTNITGTAAGLSIGGTAAIATSAVKVATTNFSIEESGGKLVFKYGATTIASMTSAGVLTVLSNVSSNGTP